MLTNKKKLTRRNSLIAKAVASSLLGSVYVLSGCLALEGFHFSAEFVNSALYIELLLVPAGLILGIASAILKKVLISLWRSPEIPRLSWLSIIYLIFALPVNWKLFQHNISVPFNGLFLIFLFNVFMLIGAALLSSVVAPCRDGTPEPNAWKGSVAIVLFGSGSILFIQGTIAIYHLGSIYWLFIFYSMLFIFAFWALVVLTGWASSILCRWRTSVWIPILLTAIAAFFLSTIALQILESHPEIIETYYPFYTLAYVGLLLALGWTTFYSISDSDLNVTLVRSAMWANLGFWVLSLGFHSFTPGWLPQQGSFGIFTINQVQQGSRLNNILLPQLAKVYDFDRDGFPLLHGIDCKDWDPHANLLNGGCGGNSTEELKRPSVKRVLRKTSDHVLSAVEKVAKRNRGRNLLLITIDSLRADHLNTYGYPIETAPNLDRLAKKGQVFLNHYTNGASTPISLPVLLHSQSFMDLRTDLPNLVGVLRGKGYRTYHLSDGKYILRNYIFQVEDDLDVINKGNPDQIAQETVNILSRKDDQKKLVWVYLYSLKGSPHHYRTLKVDTPTNRIKLYDKNIRYHDGVVGKILDGLSAKNVLDETVVAFFSDHGEAYMEHGQYHHGYSLYHEHIRTPLILRIPGLPPGKFHFRTSNLDMMPTILQALGLIIPRGLKGISLVEATIDPSIVPERPFYLQSINDYSVIDGRWYLIWNDGLSFELYDEYKDPTHRTNIIRENEEVARSLLLIHQDYFLKARTHIRRDPKFIMKRKQIREILKK